MPLSLFTTSVARASPSMSSAMISIGRPCWTAFSSAGRRSGTALIFLSVIRMSAFSRTVSIRSGLVTKYAEM